MTPLHRLVAALWLVGLAILPAPVSLAQSQGLVVRDGTLGAGPLAVPAGTDPLGRPADYLITPELGEQRGANLFHSFASFGIGTGKTATFTGPDPIEGPQSVANVISRVTGGAASEIDGRLRSTIPGADVYLLNPSGILFGAGAQLDVAGSFHASTADALVFEDGARLEADVARPSVLTTAPPAAFGFLGESAAAPISVTGATLETVRPGDTISLVGGDVELDGSTLKAENGRVNLAAAASAGEVGLAPANADEPLAMRGFGALGEIRLQARDDQGSLVDVGGSSPGSVFVRGGKLVVEGHRQPVQLEDPPHTRSRILAENRSPVPADPDVPGPGLISIRASESVIVDNGLLSVSTSSAGNAGTIHIGGFDEGQPSPDVTFQNGPGLVDPTGGLPQETDAGARAETISSGAAGEIRIEARDLIVRDGVAVHVAAIGSSELPALGKGGVVEIVAHSIEVFERSYIASGAWGSFGGAGTIDITLVDEGVVGGSLVVDANRDAHGPGESYAWILSQQNGGSPGVVKIDGGSVTLRNGGSISAQCNSPCGDDAGTIEILDADSVTIASGGFINAQTTGAGKGGSITIDADSVAIASGGVINAQTTGVGNGGVISIDADSVAIASGGFINASSIKVGPPSAPSTGDAGEIVVHASDSIFLSHAGGEPFNLRDFLVAQFFGLPYSLTGIFSATLGGGDGGEITLDAPEITVTDGAIVATSTLSGGVGGDVLLSGDRIRIADGGFVDTTSMPYLSAQPGGVAGNVTLDATESIEVVGDASRVASASFGSGTAGAVTLLAPRILVDGGAVATSAVPHVSSVRGAGGTIKIKADELLVRGGGRVDASTLVAGEGGSIDVTAQRSIVVEGPGSGIASRTGGEGPGGNVELSAPHIAIRDGGEISAQSTSGDVEVRAIFTSFEGLMGPPLPADATDFGDAGAVTLVADTLRLDGGTIAIDAEAADGGDVSIQASRLVQLERSEITANVAGGQGGSVAIQDPLLVVLDPASTVSASAKEKNGYGGQIEVRTALFLASAAQFDASAPGGPSFSGTVVIHSPDVDLAGTLTALPESFLDASSLMRERCAARGSGERAGSFAVQGAGIPAGPDGLLPVAAPFASAVPIVGVAPARANSLAPVPERWGIFPVWSCSWERAGLLIPSS